MSKRKSVKLGDIYESQKRKEIVVWDLKSWTWSDVKTSRPRWWSDTLQQLKGLQSARSIPPDESNVLRWTSMSLILPALVANAITYLRAMETGFRQQIKEEPVRQEEDVAKHDPVRDFRRRELKPREEWKDSGQDPWYD